MEHRPATLADLDRILTIVGEARRFLKENGLPQWQSEYPARNNFEQDIAHGWCHVFMADGLVVGMTSVCLVPEENYRLIEQGAWMTQGEDYAVIHRFAMAEEYRGRGLSTEMLSFSESSCRMSGCPSIRVDTHPNNKSMRALLEKHGYAYCGMIYLDGVRSPDMARVCYEKVL